MVRTRNCWLFFWEWYKEVQIKGLYLRFPFNCFGISLVNDQTPVYTQHNTVLLHHHQQCILSISFQGSTNAIYWLLDGVTVHIYTGPYVASVEFCNSLNVMLSNLSRMSKSSWPTENHPTYDLNVFLNSTTLAHGISIYLRVRVDKRNFDTWLLSTSTCLHSYLCVWLISGVL